MRRPRLIAAVVLVVLGTAAVAVRQGLSHQPEPANGNGKPAAPLPISQVVLFNSGVGYFQREGQIDGDAHVDLSFPAGDVNDLLKSLILQDAGGGKVGAVSYDSADPLERTLKSFALDLTNNPTLAQLLIQARGEKVEVVRQPADAASVTVTGTIVGIESHKQILKDQLVEAEQLNLLTEDGLRGLPLGQVQRVRLLNPALDSEFRRALEVVARAHDVQKKGLRLHFLGNGRRTVRVGYVLERPIWKSSYRLSLDQKGKPFMQGWALVENTSDDDWNGVRMALVTGRPISFRMNLYQPLYVPRPLVEPELFATLRPPVYAGEIAKEGLGKREEMALKGLYNAEAATPPPAQVPFGGLPGGKGQSPFVAGSGGRAISKDASPLDRLTIEQLKRRLGVEAERIPELGMVLSQARNPQDLENIQRILSEIHGRNFKDAVTSMATSQDVGDSYRYLIDQKITIPRQKSSMVPIVNKGVEGSKVSIYNAAVHAKFPLLGLRLKNTTGHPLMQGPITVYEDNVYAGDTRILDLQSDEERLVSYAIDLGTEVAPASKSSPSPQMTFKIGGNNLTAHFKVRETTTYAIKNRSTQDRLVLLEHPIRNDWKLVVQDKKESVEKSRDMYRFPVKVAAGKAVSFPVKEEQDRVDVYGLLTGDKDNPPRHALAYGIEVRPVTKAEAEELMSVRIVKGVVEAKYRQRESKTYFIQNSSDDDRTFTVDHIIRPDWRLLGEKMEKGPGVHRFLVKVAAGKTGSASVTEEHTVPFKEQRLSALDEAKLREFLQSKATPEPVRAAVGKTLAYQEELDRLVRQLKEVQGKHKELSEDQSRVRENLKILSKESETYKRFLEKFEKQETRLEELQLQIRQAQSTIEARRKSHEEYLNNLTVP
jgi:hypothetical protein